VTGNKAVVRLDLKNGFQERIESARAAVFVLDDQGKMLAQASKWVIGGTREGAPLAADSETKYEFVVQSPKPFLATNLVARLSFSRLVLEGNRPADPVKDVSITPGRVPEKAPKKGN
jgi:hypothetical protein